LLEERHDVWIRLERRLRLLRFFEPHRISIYRPRGVVRVLGPPYWPSFMDRRNYCPATKAPVAPLLVEEPARA